MQLLFLVHITFVCVALTAMGVHVVVDGLSVLNCPNKYTRMSKKRELLRGVVLYTQMVAGTSAFFGAVGMAAWATGGAA